MNPIDNDVSFMEVLHQILETNFTLILAYLF